MATMSPSKYDLDLPSQGLIRPRRIHLPPFLETSSAGSVLAYLGIPFAQSPTGSLRWKVPQGPLLSWSSVRESRWASDPFQDFLSMEGMYYGRAGAKTKIDRSEDCLYLNVWVPETDSHATTKPVLVWIYGGAFVTGNCSRPLHDGARLAHESGCIVVSLTYRVGAMGFLGSRSMAQEDAGSWPLLTRSAFQEKPKTKIAVGAGNWGLYDLVAGLLWIQHSIGAFGGDAGNVTVFGESAGSIAIHYLILSPIVPEGLFRRAILESGVVATLIPRTTASIQATFDYLAQKLCPPHLEGDERAQLQYLRDHTSADRIASTMKPLMGKRPRSEYAPMAGDIDRLAEAREDVGSQPLSVTDQWAPVWDGVFVDPDFLKRCMGPLPSRKELRNGKDGIVIGLCADEGTMFNFLIATEDSLSQHQKLYHAQLSSDLQRTYEFKPSYGPNLGGRAKLEADQKAFYTCALYTGDAMFTAPILEYLTEQAANGISDSTKEQVEVYGYLLAHRPSEQLLESLTTVPEMTARWGAFHTLDIPFVFGLDGVDSPASSSSSSCKPGKMNSHVWACNTSEYGVDPAEDDVKGTEPLVFVERGEGMTREERQLSYLMMQTWASIARKGTREIGLTSGAVWEPLSDLGSKGVGGLRMMTFGQAPQLPVPAPSRSDQGIKVAQMTLGEHAFLTSNTVKGTSLQERIDFWMKEPITSTNVATHDDGNRGVKVTRLLQNYYGYLRTAPKFIDW